MTRFRGQARAEVYREEELTPVDDHRRRILDSVVPLDPLPMKLGDALGLVLAEDITAGDPLPSFASSAMDGYAVVAADTAGASVEDPVRLEVRGEITAGASDLPPVEPGTAVRIMTGAAVPPGADAVIPVERTSEEHGEVGVHVPTDPGTHVRRIGEDVAVGTTLLRSGRRLRPADLALLAAIGAHRVACVPSPRVVVLSTGDELVPPARRPGIGQLRDSNGVMLQALVRDAGGVPFPAGIVRDDRRELAHALDNSTGHADLIVATGGVSAGTKDYLNDVVLGLGTARTYKVAMKPGMPQMLGRVGDVPVLGLPGNPVSAFVSFEVFVRPAIRRLQGREDVVHPEITARLTEGLSSPPGKRSYVRVRLSREEGRWLATPSGPQGSHVLSSLASADGLARIRAAWEHVDAGTDVPVMLMVDA